MSTAARRTLYPAIEPYRSGYAARLAAARDLLGGIAATRDGKPAVFVHGGPGAGASPVGARLLRPEALPHRRVRPARLRPQPAAREPRGQHHLAPRGRHGARCASTSASSAGWCSAARGARRWRSPTRRRTRSASASWCCAASSCCARPRSTGSTSRARARSSRTAGRHYVAAIPKRERGDLVARVLPAAHLAQPRDAAARGARLVDLGSGDELPARQRRQRRQVGRGRLRDRGGAHRVPLLRQQGLPRAARTSCCAACAASATSLP